MTAPRAILAIACTLTLQTTAASGARTACGDDPGDAAAVAAAHAAVGASCSCTEVPNHGAYVRCAAGVLAVRVANGQLRRECKGAVKRCAARSTCGRPGAVTCCRTSGAGRLKCSVKSGPERCRAPKGGTACIGTVSSCCDACASGTCVQSTSSTATTTSTSTTSTSIATPCGATHPQCNGSCPPGEYCAPEEAFPPSACTCVPVGVTPCSTAAFPACGGVCSGGGVCAPVRVYTSVTGPIEYCGCLDPAADCSGSFQGAMCPGRCPENTVCYGEPEPAGLGSCVGCLPVSLPTTTIVSTSTTTSTVPPPACGDTYPLCNGSCPPGSYCSQDAIGGQACACFAFGLEACEGATFPTCGGTCSGTGVCGPVAVYAGDDGTFSLCACLDPASTCSGSFSEAMCPGVCPQGTVCYAEPEPANLGGCVGCLPASFFP